MAWGHHDHEDTEIKEIEESIRCIERRLKNIEETLEALVSILSSNEEVRSFTIVQTGGNMANSVTSVTAGTTGTFTARPVPAGSIIPKGQTPAWASDNPLAVVTTDSTDPSGLSVKVAVDPTSPAGSFNLSISVTRSDGTPATGTVNVPIVAAAPPPPVEVSSFDIVQTS